MSYNRPRSRSGMKTNGYVATTTKSGFGKALITLAHGCYICGDVYSSAGSARNHIRNVHRYDIPGRVNGVNRPIDKKYQYMTDRNTMEYNEVHYACPSCWFHCSRYDLSLFRNHTVTEHSPKRIMLESDDEYDMYIGIDNHSKGSDVRSRSRNSRPSSRQSKRSTNSRPSSRQSNRSTNSRQSNRSTNNRPSSHQGYFSSDEEEVSRNRPSSRQVRILDDRKDTSPINEEDKNELSRKIDELRELFHALFRY